MRAIPRDLAEVVYVIITTASARDLSVRSQVIIKGYLAQHFAAAMRAHPECADVLEALFSECVKPLTGPVPPEEGEPK